MSKTINGFDCDGVITVGIHPGPNDIIITGRSYEEKLETYTMLEHRGISNNVIFNDLPYDMKTRETSGIHKAKTITDLKLSGIIIKNFFEDDPIQWEIIEEKCPWVNVIHVIHALTNKENERHINDF